MGILARNGLNQQWQIFSLHEKLTNANKKCIET